jgi:hypothetical protein
VTPPAESDDIREGVLGAFKEITGEHRAYKPERQADTTSRLILKIMLTVLGVVTGIVVTSAIAFTKSCSTIEVVERFATKTEMQSLDMENSKAHAIISTKLDGIEKTTSAILETVGDLKRASTPAKSKRRGEP